MAVYGFIVNVPYYSLPATCFMANYVDSDTESELACILMTAV